MMAAPVHPGEMLHVVPGGTSVLRALERRIGEGRGDIAMDLYQLSERSTADALLARADRGDAIHVLGDARLRLGGLGDELERITGRGSWQTYGGSDPNWWQHAKAYHFAGSNGPEAWITNLAPIPDTHQRTELAVVVGGDAAAAARAVTEATLDGSTSRIQGTIDAAAGQGILVNDPIARRSHLTEGIAELLEDNARDDLLVVTKGIQDAAMTDRLVAARAAGRDVRVYVRDLSRIDAERLRAGDVPTWVVGGGLKPRVNLIHSGDRAIVGSAFLWARMVGSSSETTSRDIGVLLANADADAVRGATMDAIEAMPVHTPVEVALDGAMLASSI